MKKALKGKVQEIADKVNGSMYEGYSGKGMFGALCYGVECGHSQVAEAIHLGKQKKLGQAYQDELGLQAIVYWPMAKD